MPSSGKRRKRGGAPDAQLLVKAAAGVLAVIALLWCWNVGQRLQYRRTAAQSEPVTAQTLEQKASALAISDADRNDAPASAERVDLSETESDFAVTGGAPIRLQGRLDGTLHVDAPEQTVHLILDNVEIVAADGPAIRVEDADRVIITLAPDSKNYLTDAASRSEGDDSDGCIYSTCDLVFNGTGSLEVNGLYQDAVRSRDAVKIVDGTYRLQAKRTAIRGNDGIHIAGGVVFAGGEKNGMQTTKRGADGRGSLILSGGEISVVAGRYAFVVEKAQLFILDCSVQTSSVAGDFSVNGTRYIEDGCMT